MKFDISVFIENLSRKLKFHLNRTRITGALHEDQYTFSIMSLSVSLRMRCFRENHVIYEIMWKDIVESDGPQMTLRRMRIACWITRATLRMGNTYCFFTSIMVARTHLNVAFIRTYIACLVVNIDFL